jgi:hypothetical protein
MEAAASGRAGAGAGIDRMFVYTYSIVLPIPLQISGGEAQGVGTAAATNEYVAIEYRTLKEWKELFASDPRRFCRFDPTAFVVKP